MSYSKAPQNSNTLNYKEISYQPISHIDTDFYFDSDMESEAEEEMQKLMGFSNFGGTKKAPQHGSLPSGRPRGGALLSTGANSEPVVERQTASTSVGQSSAPNNQESPTSAINTLTPASLPPRPVQPSSDSRSHQAKPNLTNTPTSNEAVSSSTIPPLTHPAQTQPQNQVNQSNRSSAYMNNKDPNAIGYTNPLSGISMTNSELERKAAGETITKIDANGNEYEVTSYFLPSFVEEDPWRELKVKAGLIKE